MRLTEQQKQQVRSQLEGSPGHCQVCGSQEWIIIDEMWALKPFFGPEPTQPVSHPLVAFFCAHCHQVILLSAIGLGLVAVPDKDA